MQDGRPEVKVESDYDGYFETLVRRWIQQKVDEAANDPRGPQFKSKLVVISAGPYRASAVTTERRDETTLHIDFYSAIRTGFGSLSASDISEIKEKWL